MCFFKAVANCAGKKAKLLFEQDTTNLSVSLPPPYSFKCGNEEQPLKTTISGNGNNNVAIQRPEMTCEIWQIILQFSVRVFSSQTYGTHTHRDLYTREASTHTYYLCWHFLLLVLVSSSSCTFLTFLFACAVVVLFFRCFTWRSMCLQNIKTTTRRRRRRGRKKKKTKTRATQATLTAKLLSVSLSSCAQSCFNTHTHAETHTQIYSLQRPRSLGPVSVSLPLPLTFALAQNTFCFIELLLSI